MRRALILPKKSDEGTYVFKCLTVDNYFRLIPAVDRGENALRFVMPNK